MILELERIHVQQGHDSKDDVTLPLGSVNFIRVFGRKCANDVMNSHEVMENVLAVFSVEDSLVSPHPVRLLLKNLEH